MERRFRRDSKALWVLKALLVSYIVTGVLLLVLAMLRYAEKVELFFKYRYWFIHRSFHWVRNL